MPSIVWQWRKLQLIKNLASFNAKWRLNGSYWQMMFAFNHIRSDAMRTMHE